jgi:hypothetical protein
MMKLAHTRLLSMSVVRLTGLQPTCLPLKAPWLGGSRTSAHPMSPRTNHSTTSPSRPNDDMAKPKSSEANILQAPPRWQQISWQKKDEQYARIPHEWRLPSKPSSDITTYMGIPRQCGILSQEELQITEEYDATALAEAIRSRTLKCIDVTRAFCKVGVPLAVEHSH